MENSKRKWVEKQPRVFDDAGLVDDFIRAYKQFFEDNKNSWFGKEHMFRGVANHWLKNGCFGADYDDITIIQAEAKWRDWIEMHTEIKE